MKRYKAFGILLSVALLAVVLYRADLSKVATALRGADYRYLPFVVVIYLTSFFLRSWRWRVLLAPIKPDLEDMSIHWVERIPKPPMQDIIKYAYVIYNKDYLKNTNIVFSYLNDLGIYCTGRFGTFQYINMDTCVEMSKRLVQTLNK